MLSNIVSVGNRIELYKISNTMNNIVEPNSNKHYISQVYDILSEGRITIAMPIVEGRIIPLEVDDQYEVIFITSKGLYKCFSIICDRYKQDGLYVLVIDIISDLKKHQRRQYYRLECLLELKYRLLFDAEVMLFEKNKEYITTEGEFIKASSLDLSGGGMRFISPQKLSVKDKIIVMFTVYLYGEKYEYNVIAIVKDTDIVKNQNGLYESRIEFANLNENKREILIKYIFEEERIQRKRAKDL